MAFDAAERNGRFGRIQCQRGKESSSRGKKKRQVFLCRRTVGVKVIPASVLKIEGRGARWGERPEREGRIEELVGGQNPDPEAPPRSEGNVRRGAMEKSGCVRIVEGEEVRRDDPVEYFLPVGVGSTS